MATISAGATGRGRRAVDADVPLVPFIDLLLCCIMFLLVTAVWNELAQIDASLPGRGETSDALAPVAPRLLVEVRADAVVLSTDAGDHVRVASDALASALDAQRRLAPNVRTAVLTSEDGVAYDRIVSTMDALVASGYRDLSVAAGER